MIFKKYCKIYSIVVLSALAICAFILGIFCFGNAGKVSAQGPVFDDEISFRTEYGAGYTLTVLGADFEAGDKKIPASAVLTYEGETVATLGAGEASFRYKLEQTGKYDLTYYCEYEGEIFTRSFGFTVSDRPYFEHSLQSVYPIGSDLPLTATAVWKGERKTAVAKVNGKDVSGDVYHAASLGKVTVTFSAEFEGKTYEEVTEVTVRLADPSDLFIGVSGITSIEADNDAPEWARSGNGVKIMAGTPGAVARYSNVINLNSFDQNTNLITFFPLSGDGYTSLQEVVIRLVDVHDPSNTVHWRFYSVSWETGGCTAYAGFNYDGREMGRFNEAGERFGEVRTDWMAQIPNATFDVTKDKKDNRMWFSAQTDYKNRSFYVTTEMPAGQDPWLLLDADNSSQVGVGKEWKGFTTGEVWLEIEVSGSSNTGFLVKEVAGQSLSGTEIKDTTKPYVLTDYIDDANMPVGTANQKYPIPQALRVLDAVEGELDPASVGISLFKVNGILMEECSELIEGDSFIPPQAGIYRIGYTAKDSSGNESVRYIDVEISETAAEISVSCDLPETAFVGETLNLPNVNVTGMTTLTTRTVKYSFNGKELSVGAGNDYTFTEEGKLTLFYEFIDYVNNRCSDTLELNVSVSPDPVITVRGMPYTAISGKDLYLPDFTAYDYNYPESDPRFEPVKAITVNGKAVDTDKRVYSVTEKAGQTLEVVFSAGKTKVTKTVQVISPVYVSDYFLAESSSEVNKINAESYTGFRFNNDISLKTANAVVVDNYSGFLNSFELSASGGTLEIVMTDYLRPYKSVFFRIDLARQMMTINGSGTEYPIQHPQGGGNKIELRYRDIGKLLADYGVIATWTDGTAFDGFERGLAVIEWNAKDIQGEAELKLYELGMTKLVTSVKDGVPQPFADNGVPSIVLSASVYDQSPSIGQSLFVPAAEGYTALSGSCDIKVSVYNAAGDVVLDKAFANKDYYCTVDSYGVWLIEYRVTYADGAIDERSMPITVSSSIPPVVKVSGEIPETAKKGSSFTLPEVTVTGTGDTESYYSLTAPDGKVTVHKSGEKITFGEAGEYRLTLVASDDWNYTVNHYSIAVKEG